MRKAQLFRDAHKLQQLATRTAAIHSLPKRPTYRDRLDVPYEPPSEFETRLHNWKRAHRWIKSSDTNHTFPAYRYLRAPLGVEVEYETGEPPPRARPDPIDWEDAWECELAWRDLPRRPRWVLKLHVHAMKHPKHACRLLRQLAPVPVFVHPDDWETAFEQAKTELELQLDLRKLSGTTYRNGMLLEARASTG